jgi:hypothetical protein
MKDSNLNEVLEEISRFQRRVDRLKKAKEEYSKHQFASPYYRFPAEVSAIKRASMDLTRALAKLRNNEE